MKIRLSYIIFALTLLFATQGYSQMDRTVGRNQYKNGPRKVKKTDFVEDATAYLTKELKLDSFQEAAIRNIIAQYKDAAAALNEDKNIKMQERKDRGNAISLKIYSEALPLLSKEQAEIYTKMIEEQSK